jgi:hypothetical protein
VTADSVGVSSDDSTENDNDDGDSMLLDGDDGDERIDRDEGILVSVIGASLDTDE